MDAVISGLIIAAFSAVTFVAYRHPDAYQRHYYKQAFILIGTGFAVIGWTVFMAIIVKTALAYIPAKSQQAYLNEMHRYIPLQTWPTLTIFGGAAYVLVLTGLRKFLGGDEGRK